VQFEVNRFMATMVVMPKLGNTVESSILLRWLKQKGELVKQGEALCEVETDKATMEVESPADGILLDMFFSNGDEVPVMIPIAAIGEPGEDFDSLRPDTMAVQRTPRTNGQATSKVVAAEAAGRAPSPVSGEARGDSIVGISPRAKNLAKDKGLELTGVVGTGPGGRIIERDVQAALSVMPRMTPLARSMVEAGDFVAPAQGSGVGGRITTRDLQPTAAVPAAPKAIQPGDDEVQTIPVRGVRKLIAERMLSSIQTTAQLTLNASADARGLLEYRKRLKNSAEALGLQKVTINHLVLFVVSRTLMQYPELNALFSGDTISRYKDVHLGFAVDTDRGLIVPVIHSANSLSLKQIAEEADRLAQACLDGAVSPDDMQGGTFTVTNLGSLGIESFTPILNPPQVGILGVSNINLKPVEVEGEVEFIPHLGLSLTINHQVVDGAPAARFLQALSRNIAQIEILLAL
jgi:pyruvate dehydrogenase E2 component (dihydrolipoamide acetyltransferase)